MNSERSDDGGDVLSCRKSKDDSPAVRCHPAWRGKSPGAAKFTHRFAALVVVAFKSFLTSKRAAKPTSGQKT